MPGSRLIRALSIVFILLLILLIIWAVRPAGQVRVVSPQKRRVVELVIDSGVLQASLQTNLGTQVTGVVDNVFVSEGDRAIAGQTVIALDSRDADERVRQAQLAVRTAQEELEVAGRGPLPSEVARARAELAQAEQQGAANVAAARQRLRDLQTGGRPEEIRQAQSALNAAQATRRQAGLDLSRAEYLLQRGAIPQSEADRARTALERARADEQSAAQALALARQPASAEEIGVARAELQAAEAVRAGAVRTARENLRTLLAQPRPEDVRVARARLQEAQAAVRQVQEDLSKRTIRSPVNGLVTSRDVEPGQSVNPGNALVTIADLSRTEVYVETDEDNLPRLRLGQQATVIAPAFRNQPFRAVVFRIGPDIDTEQGVVPVRLRPVSLPSYARLDMTVDVNIEVSRFADAWSIPASSVIEADGRAYVFLVENGRARRVPVEVIGRSTDLVALREADPNWQVVMRGTEVEPGQRVRPME